MWARSLWAVAALLLPCTAIAETLEIALQHALGNTAVVAYDASQRAFVAQSVLLRTEEQTAIHKIENKWKCAGGQNSGPSLIVFGADNAATSVDAKEVCRQANAGQRVSIELRPPPAVNLFIWPRERKLEATIHDEVANTNWLYRRNLVGVRYTAKVFLPGFGLDFTVKQTQAGDGEVYEVERKGVRVTLKSEAQDPNCDALRATSNLLVPGGINVFVGFARNWTCAANDHHRTDIILISDVEALGALAHEIGHASGLNSATDGTPDIHYDRGHVPPLTNGGSAAVDPKTLFGASNSLWPRSMILHDALTLGQVFWMNFSEGSYLAQTRAADPGAAANLRCPEPDSCPAYHLDFSLPDPRGVIPPSPAAHLITTTRPAVTSPCGAELNAACPPAAFSLGAMVGGITARLKGWAGLGKEDAAFNLHFALTARLDAGLAKNHPHYCTKAELIDTLRKRFAAACGSQNPGGTKCGHRDVGAFIDQWKKSITAAGLIEVTAAGMQEARAAYSNGAAAVPGKADYAYEGQAYVAARHLIAEKPLNLKKAHGKRVLWMDDPGANRIEQDLLKSLGMRIGCSQRPSDAVQQLVDAGKAKSLFFGDGPYELVIARSDPGDLFRQLTERKIRVPVILYSGDAQNDATRVPDAFGVAHDPVRLTELVIQSLDSKR